MTGPGNGSLAGEESLFPRDRRPAISRESFSITSFFLTPLREREKPAVIGRIRMQRDRRIVILQKTLLTLTSDVPFAMWYYRLLV